MNADASTKVRKETNVGEGEQKLHSCCKKDLGPLFYCFKEGTEGDMTTGAGSLFQYFITHTENALLLRRRRLGPCSYR